MITPRRKDAKGRGRLSSSLLCAFLSGCMMPMTAKQLAGFSEKPPEVEIVKGKTGDWSFRAATDFKGSAKIDVRPDGYSLEINSMESASSPVIVAEGERAAVGRLLEMRVNEAQLIASERAAMYDFFGIIVQSAADVVKVLGPALLAPKPANPVKSGPSWQERLLELLSRPRPEPQANSGG